MKAIITINLPEGIYLEDAKLKDFWSWIAAFYPGYTQSDEIAYNGDLQKIIDGEWEEGDCAWKLIQERWGGNVGTAQEEAAEELEYSNLEIYEGAIQGFIDNVEKIELVYDK